VLASLNRTDTFRKSVTSRKTRRTEKGRPKSIELKRDPAIRSAMQKPGHVLEFDPLGGVGPWWPKTDGIFASCRDSI